MPCKLHKCSDFACDFQGRVGAEAVLVVRGTAGEAVLLSAVLDSKNLPVEEQTIGGGQSLPGVTLPIGPGTQVLQLAIAFSQENGRGELCEVCAEGEQERLAVLDEHLAKSDDPVFGYRVQGVAD